MVTWQHPLDFRETPDGFELGTDGRQGQISDEDAANESGTTTRGHEPAQGWGYRPALGSFSWTETVQLRRIGLEDDGQNSHLSMNEGGVRWPCATN